MTKSPQVLVGEVVKVLRIKKDSEPSEYLAISQSNEPVLSVTRDRIEKLKGFFSPLKDCDEPLRSVLGVQNLFLR